MSKQLVYSSRTGMVSSFIPEVKARRQDMYKEYLTRDFKGNLRYDVIKSEKRKAKIQSDRNLKKFTYALFDVIAEKYDNITIH